MSFWHPLLSPDAHSPCLDLSLHCLSFVSAYGKRAAAHHDAICPLLAKECRLCPQPHYILQSQLASHISELLRSNPVAATERICALTPPCSYSIPATAAIANGSKAKPTAGKQKKRTAGSAKNKAKQPPKQKKQRTD